MKHAQLSVKCVGEASLKHAQLSVNCVGEENFEAFLFLLAPFYSLLKFLYLMKIVLNAFTLNCSASPEEEGEWCLYSRDQVNFKEKRFIIAGDHMLRLGMK